MIRHVHVNPKQSWNLRTSNCALEWNLKLKTLWRCVSSHKARRFESHDQLGSRNSCAPGIHSACCDKCKVCNWREDSRTSTLWTSGLGCPMNIRMFAKDFFHNDSSLLKLKSSFWTQTQMQTIWHPKLLRNIERTLCWCKKLHIGKNTRLLHLNGNYCFRCFRHAIICLGLGIMIRVV